MVWIRNKVRYKWNLVISHTSHTLDHKWSRWPFRLYWPDYLCCYLRPYSVGQHSIQRLSPIHGSLHRFPPQRRRVLRISAVLCWHCLVFFRWSVYFDPLLTTNSIVRRHLINIYSTAMGFQSERFRTFRIDFLFSLLFIKLESRRRVTHTNAHWVWSSVRQHSNTHNHENNEYWKHERRRIYWEIMLIVICIPNFNRNNPSTQISNRYVSLSTVRFNTGHHFHIAFVFLRSEICVHLDVVYIRATMMRAACLTTHSKWK